MAVLRLAVLVYSFACVAYFGSVRALITFGLFPVLWVAWSWFLDRRPLTRAEFQWTAILAILIVYVPLCWFYVREGIWASPEKWGVFDTSVSPLGRSPCCRSTGAACNGVPYHPAGFYVYGVGAPRTTSSPPVTFCSVGRWADSSGAAVVAHNREPGTLDEVGPKCVAGFACDALASREAADYPNLAIGLRDGWSRGALVTPTALCPGVDRTPNARGIVGRGSEICSRCANPRPPHCADTDGSQLFCFMCLGGYLASEPAPIHFREKRFWAELLMGQGAFLVLSTLAAVPRCGRARLDKSGYNGFF